MNVLLLSKYGRAGASSRLRSYQYLPFLEQNGLSIDAQPLFSDAYVHSLYTGSPRRVAESVAGYFRRLAAGLSGRSYDVVWIEKELLPWVPFALEKRLLPNRTGFLADYDDAVFHRYDESRFAIVRGILGRKIDRLMGAADCVTVGNRYLADRAARAGATVRILPTSVDTARYAARRERRDKGTTVVGWIGTPYTARYLRGIRGALARLHADGDVEYRFIGCPAGLDLGVPYTAVEWREDTEVAELQQLDCGIMPLPDSPFERGKCGYKLIQYMACGLPVVASPVGINTEIVVPAQNGILARDEADWYQALRELAAHPGERARMGEAGRTLVEERFSTRVTAPLLLDALEFAGRQGA